MIMTWCTIDSLQITVFRLVSLISLAECIFITTWIVLDFQLANLSDKSSTTYIRRQVSTFIALLADKKKNHSLLDFANARDICKILKANNLHQSENNSIFLALAYIMSSLLLYTCGFELAQIIFYNLPDLMMSKMKLLLSS